MFQNLKNYLSEDVDCNHVHVEALEWSPPFEVVTLAGTQKIQGGLPAATVAAWRAVAKRFPKATGLGAWGDRSHMARKSCHNTGKAIDVMTTNPALHKEIVAWALKERATYGFTLIISQRKKYSAKTKWIGVPYLGKSPHTDHVHISVRCDG